MTAEPLEVELPPATTAKGGRPDVVVDMGRAALMLRDKALGFTYDQLASKYGYSNGANARHALYRALNRHEAENVSALRTIENERYEMDQVELRLIINDRTLKPELRLRAIDTRTRAAARNAALNGLNAPIELSMNGDAAKALLIERLLALREQREAEADTATDLGPETVQGTIIKPSDPALDDPLNHG